MLPAADPDLLLAGALLHDIGKIESYRWDGAFETTVAGRVIGHVVLGARRLDRAVARAPEPPCTADELELLQHLILCHHGRLEFGAPVVPLSLEGEILSQADLTSARTAGFSDVLGDTTHFPADAPFSVHSSWWLDSRQVWRGRSDWGGDGQA
jgi:3'-5' exoribonuclease